MRIHVHNRQHDHGVDVAAVRHFLHELVSLSGNSRASMPAGVRYRELDVTLVDDDDMARINERIMGQNVTTDVLVQSYNPLPGEPPGLTADLIVNVSRAWQLGCRRRGWSAAQELALYLAHGCDHLDGADDASPVDYRRMRRRELGWLRRCRSTKLLWSRP